MRPALAALALASLAGCVGAPTFGDLVPLGAGGSRDPRVRQGAASATALNNQSSGWAASGPTAGEAVLYGRDGTPVGSSRPGEVTRTAEPINGGVDDEGGSRVVLLELYHQAVQERDDLLADFDALSASHGSSEGRVADLEQQVAALEAQVAELTSQNGELQEAQFDLAARLAHAQIARLEAERALLEASLEWRRMNAANQAQAEGGQ